MVTINGVNYDEKEFGVELKNYITLRAEVQVNKARHMSEIEKADVLTAHYNKKIEKLLEKETPLETPAGNNS
mgnify:FL=1|tara:strand:- start:196 stop:411 length:216 start_codon:yes stop_codon:yes gene_type:complete